MELYDLLLAKSLGGSGGGGVTVEELNVTANGDYSEAGKAYSPVHVNVSGGGDVGKFTLLKTENLGEIVYTDSTIAEVGTYTVNIDGCMGVLFSITRDGDDPPKQVHVATYAFAFVRWSGSVPQTAISGYKIYARMTVSKTLEMNADSMGYTVFPGDASMTDSTMTFKVYKNYGSYGKINGTYTMRVYGVKYYDKDTNTPIL